LGSLNGFYTINFRIKTIYLNEKLNTQQRKISCAHELGHIILRHHMNKLFLSNNTFIVTNKFEIQADKFTVELLVPDNIIDELKSYTIDQISTLLMLPPRLIKLKLELLIHA